MRQALHDMSYPVDVLRAPRAPLGDGGLMLVGDERAEETSRRRRVKWVGMVGEGAAGTGTVMRADTVKRYAEEAGFGFFSCEVLPIENDFWRFDVLKP